MTALKLLVGASADQLSEIGIQLGSFPRSAPDGETNAALLPEMAPRWDKWSNWANWGKA